jgi:hypothetical protein
MAGVAVPVLDPGADVGFESLHALVHAAADHLGGQVAEPPLPDEAQFTALRYFALDGADHPSHKEQASMIRRYINSRNNHAYDERLRIVAKENVA